MKELLKNKKKILIILGIAAVLVILAVVIIKGTGGDSSSENEEVQYETCKVESSEMKKELTAAGEVTAAETEDIEFSTSKTFRAMCVEVNEIVSKGQNLILYEDGTHETAPADGVIISINPPDTGDVGTSENLIEFGRTGKLSLEVTVPEDQISEIAKGDEATIVVGSDSSKTFYGKITGKREMSTTLISEKSEEAAVAAAESEDSTAAEGADTSSGAASGGNASGVSGTSGTDPFGSESSTAYYTVVLEFTNDGSIRPGMSASCTVTISDRNNVLTVPVEAVYYDNDGKAYVNIVEGNSTEKQIVKTGESDSENVEIKKGLEEGDKIQVEAQK